MSYGTREYMSQITEILLIQTDNKAFSPTFLFTLHQIKELFNRSGQDLSHFLLNPVISDINQVTEKQIAFFNALLTVYEIFEDKFKITTACFLLGLYLELVSDDYAATYRKISVLSR